MNLGSKKIQKGLQNSFGRPIKTTYIHKSVTKIRQKRLKWIKNGLSWQNERVQS